MGEASRRDSQLGFTTIELLIVMVIMSILGAIGYATYDTAKTSASKKAVAAAGASYKNGISAFMLEHGNRVPIMGTTDWPTAAKSSRWAGPKDQMNKPYMRQGAPETVSEGVTDIGAPTNKFPPDINGRILYAPVFPPGPPGQVAISYTLRVQFRAKSTDPWKDICMLGNTAGVSDTC